MQIHKSTQKIVAGLLSFAMVLTLVVGLSASSASAATTFSRNLTVGSQGSDVTALQTMLQAGGFFTATPTGYFGSITKRALAAWQASVGIVPAAGYFGMITRNYIATSGGGVSTVPGCSAGSMYSSTSGAPCTTTTTIPGCMPGALFSSTTGVSCSSTASTGGALDNTDGSITASLSTFAGNTSIKKGETKDMVAVKLQATAGKVAVNRFDVRINNRPWLYFSKLTLKDSDGNVIATKNLTGSSDATEITVGSDYMVRFDGLNYVVSPGTDKTLVVSGTVLAATDKLSSDVTVTVSIPDNSIRVVNGKGYTDSLGLGAVATVGTSGRSITLSSSGSTGNIVVRTSPSTLAARIVNTSTTGVTSNVELGKFDFKSENQSSTLNTLSFTLRLSTTSTGFSTLYKNVRLTDGTNTYNVSSVATTSTFSNLNISLAQDTWKTLTLVADVADQDEFGSGSMASTSITVNNTNIVGVDANYNTLTATGANVAASNNVTFLANAATVSGISASQTLVDNGTSASNKSLVRFAFTLNNTGSNDLYVSKTPALAIATTTSGSASTTSTTVTTSPSTDSGDTASVYRIAAGQSRTFTYESVVSDTGNAAANIISTISTIYFGDDTTNIQESNINFGLEGLRVSGMVY
jgi:hypothetical protein